jgi:hypothetical protein
VSERRKLKIGDREIEVTVASEEECEEVAFVVCVPASTPGITSLIPGLEPDVLTACSRCEIPIRHRPHAPKKPRKVCMKCAVELMGAS